AAPPAGPSAGWRAGCGAAGDATAEHRRLVSGRADGPIELGDQHVQHRILKRASEMRPIALEIVRRAHRVQHRGLQPGERKLEAFTNHRAGKGEPRRIALTRESLDGGAARVTEAEERGDFVE